MVKLNFIKIDNKLINLEHVSSINVLKNRVAFDFDCNVQIKDRYISYYVYNDTNNFEFKDNKYIKDNFISHKNIYINLNHINLVTFEQDKNRIIFNLSHSVTTAKYDGTSRLTSKFIYFDFITEVEYNEYANKLKKL